MFALIGPVEDEDVLDLFAGSGALGLEALSRGARSATLVDRSAPALASARANARDLGLDGRVTLIRADWRQALRRLEREGARFGLCLLDPPYSLLPRIAEAIGPALAPVLAAGSAVVVEHGADDAFELSGLPVERADRRRYGDSGVTLLRMEST
jgi:16S rRNA (guanine966-N2)-methyltransferase